MSVGLNITLLQGLQVSNFVFSPIVGTIDADVIPLANPGGPDPLLKPEKYKKNF